MTSVDERRQTAHEIYARARASFDSSKRQELLNLADDYLKRADELRRGHVVQAVFPKAERNIR